MIWGGDSSCKHVWKNEKVEREIRTGLGLAKFSEQYRGGGHKQGKIEKFKIQRGYCSLCEAWCGVFGLEPTYQMYVEHSVQIFREVRRVLRPDGTLWLNLGDSYAGSWGNSGSRPELDGKTQNQRDKSVEYWARGGWDERRERPPSSYKQPGLKPKDLCGIPWRVAFALQADGWYLRQDIIWSKPNPMPESVKDRCTKAHEYLFMLTKSPNYYYDAEAIKEPQADTEFTRSRYKYSPSAGNYAKKQNSDTNWNGGELSKHWGEGSRNKRSVWEIATKPFPKAHFATFPPKLVETCIKAGTSSKGCCTKCGAPWVRKVEKVYRHHEKWFGDKQDARHSRGKAGTAYNEPISTKTIGWSPSCSCNAKVIPCTVLDPFGGAGTTGMVADDLGRDAILIELSPDYVKMSERRIHNRDLLFAQVAVE